MSLDITWMDAHLPSLLSEAVIPLGTQTVLDLGCGKGIAGAVIRATRPIGYLVGLEIHRPYIDYLEKQGVYDKVLEYDLREVPLPFRDQEFDVVLALEVLEHLGKDDGLRLLSEAERIGRKVVVSVPKGFFPQPALDGNTHQRHQSEWTPGDFKSNGYQLSYAVRCGRRVKVQCIFKRGYQAAIFSRMTNGLTTIIASQGQRPCPECGGEMGFWARECSGGWTRLKRAQCVECGYSR